MAYKTVPIPGIRLASGRQAYGSAEMAAWMPVFTEYMWVCHGLRLRWVKTLDASSSGSSASTHQGGWAGDRRTRELTDKENDLVVCEATRYGYPEHLRVPDQGFEAHGHGMLDVGYKTPCSYQITATRNGRDGLARNGVDRQKKVRPAQSKWLGYRAGIVAMQAAIAAAKQPAKKEEYMALTDAEISRIVTAIRATPVTANGKKQNLIDHMAAGFVDDRTQSTALVRLTAQVSALAAKTGAQVDEGAIVAGVVAGIAGQLSDAVHAAIRLHLRDIEDAEVDAIATSVADELARRVQA